MYTNTKLVLRARILHDIEGGWEWSQRVDTSKLWDWLVQENNGFWKNLLKSDAGNDGDDNARQDHMSTRDSDMNYADMEQLIDIKLAETRARELAEKSWQDAWEYLDAALSKLVIPWMTKGEEQNKPKTYTVALWDTLNKIAKDNWTSVEAIMALNNSIKNKNKIDVGQAIKLPPSPEATNFASAPKAAPVVTPRATLPADRQSDKIKSVATSVPRVTSPEISTVTPDSLRVDIAKLDAQIKDVNAQLATPDKRGNAELALQLANLSKTKKLVEDHLATLVRAESEKTRLAEARKTQEADAARVAADSRGAINRAETSMISPNEAALRRLESSETLKAGLTEAANIRLVYVDAIRRAELSKPDTKSDSPSNVARLVEYGNAMNSLRTWLSRADKLLSDISAKQTSLTGIKKEIQTVPPLQEWRINNLVARYNQDVKSATVNVQTQVAAMKSESLYAQLTSPKNQLS